jgi:hypothetical protein
MNRRIVQAGVVVVAIVVAAVVAISLFGGSAKPHAKNRTTLLQQSRPTRLAVPSRQSTSTEVGQPADAATLTTGTAKKAVSSNSESLMATPITKTTTKLLTITTPPPHTLAVIGGSSVSPGSEFHIVFVPFGYGPGTTGTTVAALIRSVKQTRGEAAQIDFQARNVLLHVSAAGGASTLKTGGVYSGTMTVVPQAGSYTLQLLNPVRAKH